MALLTRGDWEVTQLRLTVFPAIPLPKSTNDWWSIVVGTEPEEVTANLREGSHITGGPFATGGLVLQVLPQRIDWNVIPKPLNAETLESLAQQPRIHSIGRYTDSVPVFRNAIEKWLGGAFDFQVSRIAFGAVLEHSESDRDAGYRRLEEYLRISIPAGASDFMFQINLPAEMEIADKRLAINRLSKWSVTKATLKQLTATLGPGEASASTRDMSEPIYSTRLELDTNTAPNPGVTLEGYSLPVLLTALIESGDGYIEAGIDRK